ncbi:MAG: SDR family oxidoreductase [Bacteroidota bacterium]
MVLKKKVAVIFAAHGEISQAVSQSFAKEGAKLYLSSRSLAELEKMKAQLEGLGSEVYIQEVDACKEDEITAFYEEVVKREGKIDVIFNGIGLRPSQHAYGTPTTLISYEQFMKPLEVQLGSQFLTSRVGARFMQETESKGTILTLTSSLSRMKVPFMAGLVSACTAIEGLTRVMSAEFGMQGIKVICLNPTALYGTRTIRETSEANAKLMGLTAEAWNAQLSQQYLLRQSPSLEQVGEVAAFLASDKGIPLNSHIIDIDCGSMMVI